MTYGDKLCTICGRRGHTASTCPLQPRAWRGHVWAFNAVGWLLIYFITHINEAGLVGVLCTIPMIWNWTERNNVDD